MKKIKTTAVRRILRFLVIVPAGLVLAGCAGLATPAPEKGSFLRLSNGQAASFVIGQKNMTGTENGNDRLMDNWCSPSIIDGKLFISDHKANRFWVFSSVPQTDVATPDGVIGQDSLAEGNGGIRPFENPTAIQKQGDRYYIATHEGLISIWDKLPIGTHSYDDKALITTDTGTWGGWGTWGLSAVGGKLIVSSHERILIWNSAPTSSTTGASADIVLTGAGGGGTLFNGSNQHWTDGNKLLVTDSNNHRVLVWNSFPTSSDDPADFVLGQTDMTCPKGGCKPGTSATKMNEPTGVTSNGIQIFVSDPRNSRVLVWNSFPTVNNAPADVVLGQADFAGNLPLQGGDIVSAETLGGSNGIGFGDHKLFVADSACLPDGSCFNRWLVFESK